MKTGPVMLGVLLFAGRASEGTARRRDGGGGAVAADPHPDSEPVRLETQAGTFLVHPNTAEAFSRALAGEPTRPNDTSEPLAVD